MITIRHSVFETNSSSSHSLVFSKKNRGYDFDLPVDKDGTLVIPFGEFGWGPEVLHTPMEKLSYFVTDNAPWNVFGEDEKIPFDTLLEKKILHNQNIQEVMQLIYAHCPQVKHIRFKPNDSSYYPLGYVDHESCGTSRGAEPYELIFNNGVIVLVDNDNSCHFEEYDSRYNYRTGKYEPPEKDPEELFDIY